MASVLDKIVETKRRELDAQRAAVPQTDLVRAVQDAPPPRDFFAAVAGADEIALIAEMKKASPSAFGSSITTSTSQNSMSASSVL